MIIHLKKESFVQEIALINISKSVSKLCLFVESVAKSFILFLETSDKKTVVDFVGTGMVGKEELSQYQKLGMLRDWLLTMLRKVSLLDRIDVNSVVWKTKLKQLIMIIQNHLKLDGYVPPVIDDGIRKNQSMPQYLSLFRKRYWKFIDPENWETKWLDQQ